MKEPCTDCRRIKEVALKFKRVERSRLVEITLCKRCMSHRMQVSQMSQR